MSDAELELARRRAGNAAGQTRYRQRRIEHGDRRLSFSAFVSGALAAAIQAEVERRGPGSRSAVLREALEQHFLGDGARANTPKPSSPTLVVQPDPRLAAATARLAATRNMRTGTAHLQAIEDAKADAANRVPVWIVFERDHDYIPWGTRQRLWDNGLRRHGPHGWIGRLRPETAEDIGRQVAAFDGELRVTGVLGARPRAPRV